MAQHGIDPQIAQLGAELVEHVMANILEDSAFKRSLAKGTTGFFRGTVTGVQYSGATSTVQVRRSGAPSPDPANYPVYAAFYRPQIKDQVLLVRASDGNAFVIGVRNAGRPNEWSVAGSGGALLKYDSQYRLLEKHDDSHNKSHFRTDGKRVAHHQKEDGTHTRIGDVKRVIKGSVATDGTITGSYHRESADTVSTGAITGTGQHFHNMGDGAGERLIRQHHPYKHTHTTYSKGGQGVKGDHAKDYKSYTMPAGHMLSDDGSDSAIADPASGPTLAAITDPNPTGLAAGSYQVTYCFTNNPGVAGSTNPAPVQTVSIDAGQNIVVSAITLPAGASGITYYVSSAADSTTLYQHGTGTGSAYTISALPGTTMAPPSSNTTYVTNPAHAPTLTGSTASGTLPAGTYQVGYAFTTSWGLSQISPLASVTLASAGQITVSGMDAIPTLCNGLNIYLTPAQSDRTMLALQFAAHQATNSAITISAPQPSSAMSWPSASTAYVPDPTAQATLTANTVTTTTGLGAGTWHVSYALSVDNAGTQHTAMSPSSSVVLAAGQAIQAGPVELPPNAGYVQWFMETAASSGVQRLVSVVQVSDAQVFANAPSAGGTAPFGVNSTGTNVARGAVVLTHGGGNKAIRHTGCDHTVYSAGTIHSKHTQDKAHLHVDGSGVVKHAKTSNGDHHHTGDHIHGHTAKSTGFSGAISASLADCTNANVASSGPYIRHTRNDTCDNAHESYIHDGTSEKKIKSHGPNRGHTIHEPAGGTAVHHHHPAGHKAHIGDHYHNAGTLVVNCDGTWADPTGGYHKKTHNGTLGQYEHHHHDGTTKRKLRSHHPSQGHKIYDGAAFGSETIAHHHHTNGYHKHKGGHYQNVTTIAEDGTPSGSYHYKDHLNNRYEHHRFQGGVDYLVRHHDYVGDHGFYSQGALWVNHVLAGNGAKTKHKQHGTSSFHEHGDDGSGNWQSKHASGQVMVNHTGSSVTHSVAGSRVLQHTGTTAYHFVGDKVFAQHDGTTLTLNSNSGGAVLNPGLTHNGVLHTIFANQRGVIQHGGSGLGGQMMVNDSSGGQHLVRESTTGYLEHISTGGEMHLKTSGASGNQHTLDGNTHKFPSTAKMQSMANDSSRIDVLSGAGGGAIKVASHSTTTITTTSGGLAFPGPVNASGLLWQIGGASGGSDTGLLFKQQFIQIYDGGSGNPGDYRTPSVGNGSNGGVYGTPRYVGTSQDNNHVWQILNLHANGAIEAYGTNFNGAGGVATWGTLVTVLVNS